MNVTDGFVLDTPLWSVFQKLEEPNLLSSPSPETPQVHKTVILQLPLADLYTNLFSTNIQIDSPYRIEQALLQPFVEQRKNLLLVTTHLNSTLAVLTALNNNCLIASTEHAPNFMHHRGKGMVVVFPVQPEQRYILQTKIGEVYVDRVTLQYQDPRYEPRRRFPSAAPVLLRLALPSFLSRISADPVDFSREVGWLLKEGKCCGSLEDLLQARPLTSGATQTLFRTPALASRLHDISCGGVCLSLPTEQSQEELAQQVVALEIPLPRVVIEETGKEVAFTLRPLGLIRAVRVVPPSTVVHIRFLERLPREFEAIFERLEHTFELNSLGGSMTR